MYIQNTEGGGGVKKFSPYFQITHFQISLRGWGGLGLLAHFLIYAVFLFWRLPLINYCLHSFIAGSVSQEEIRLLTFASGDPQNAKARNFSKMEKEI